MLLVCVNQNLVYTNKSNFDFDLSNLKNYIISLDNLIDTKQIINLKENYSNIRLKSTYGDINSSASEYYKNGIEYLELRNFDLDIFTKEGIDKNTIKFNEAFFNLFITQKKWCWC